MNFAPNHNGTLRNPRPTPTIHEASAKRRRSFRGRGRGRGRGDWRSVLPILLYWLLMTIAGVVVSLILTGRLWSDA